MEELGGCVWGMSRGQQARGCQVGLETLTTEEPAEVLRRRLWRRQQGQSGTGLPFHSPSPPASRLLPVGAEATGPRDNGLPPPPSAQPPPVGPKPRRAGALASARALPPPFSGPALRGRARSPLSARHSFQDELSAQRFEIPGRSFLRSGLPYLTGTQEPRKSCQEKQPGRKRRRCHPGRGPPPLKQGNAPRPAPAPPRRRVPT